MKTINSPTHKDKSKKELKPIHDCPALGKNRLVPRAFNTAMPGKFYYKCPFCDYFLDSLEQKG